MQRLRTGLYFHRRRTGILCGEGIPERTPEMQKLPRLKKKCRQIPKRNARHDMRGMRTGSKSPVSAQFGPARLLQRLFREDETGLIVAYLLNPETETR